MSSMSFHILSVLQLIDSRSLFRVDSFLGDKHLIKMQYFKSVCHNTQQASSVYVPFAASVLVTDKVLAVLVDGVVCEMHAHIILT